MEGLKYFLHGILFSGLLLVMGFIWAVAFLTLIIVGLFIGFIIGLILFFFIVGWVNVFLTGILWNISTKSDWKNLLVHGLALFVVLLIASIPSVIVNLAVPSLVTTVVLFIVYCFIDGYLAKNVAGWFEE